MQKLIPCLLFILVASCSKAPPPCTHFNGWAMTMPYHITIGQSVSEQKQHQIQSVIEDSFAQIDQTVNNWNPESEVSKFNAQEAGIAHTPSTHLAALLTLSDEMHRLTTGKFDPTIDPLSHLWKRALASGSHPSPAELLMAQESVGWHHIHLQENQLWKDQAKTSIDLCAVSKGYCIDVIVERLGKIGFTDVIVEWAGEIRTAGIHPAGRPWTVQIEPMGDVTSLNDGAIATSGDYAQKEWGEGYFHIIDPSSLKPLQKKEGSIAAATVRAPTCALADALATSLMLFETNEEATTWSNALVEQMPEVSVWIFTQ